MHSVAVPSDQRAAIAVDLGAESCRVSLLRWLPQGSSADPQVELIHRFANGPVRAEDGSIRWPFDQIVTGVEQGIRLAAELAPEGVRSIGEPLEPPFCYRDERAKAAAEVLHRHIGPAHLREITGIELQPLNTLYQLYADHLSGRPSVRWLNLPEYLLFRLGAEPVAERTNASHTQLMDLFGGNWSREIFQAASLDVTCAPRIVPPGTLLGKLAGTLKGLPGLEETELIAPACHDTASAIAGISQPDDEWAYISCGTWSLVGTLTPQPVNGPGAREDNFTNLGAVGGATCFHKSVNGMWLLKQCMNCWEESDAGWQLPKLLAAVEEAEKPAHLLHVDDPELLLLGAMPARINAQRTRRGLPPLAEHAEAAPTMVALILHSLAERYAQVIDRVRTHTGKPLRRIVMVGGGAQNATLRRLTAERTGLEVVMGPVESSTVGNLAVQLSVLEEQIPATSPEFAQAVSRWAGRLAQAF
jgi:rhamnulokinase